MERTTACVPFRFVSRSEVEWAALKAQRLTVSTLISKIHGRVCTHAKAQRTIQKLNCTTVLRWHRCGLFENSSC